MKESEVAQENLRLYGGFQITYKALNQHREACGRFLGFLTDQTKLFFGTINSPKERHPAVKILSQPMEEKIQDLKQVSKIYEDAGI